MRFIAVLEIDIHALHWGSWGRYTWTSFRFL